MKKTSQHNKLLLTVDGDWVPRSAPGLEAVLKLCEEYSAHSTIFVAGQFVNAYPSLIAEAADAGHEIGAHGWAHVLDFEENFATTPYEKQREWLERGTEAIENVIHARPSVFRAPFLQVSDTMLKVLEELNYRVDSSVPVRRFDAGFGMVNNLGYFLSPLRPYHPDPHRLGRQGSSPIVEVPPSSFVFPISMTALRLLGPTLTLWAARRVFNRGYMLNFYCHPWEFVASDQQELPAALPSRHRRSIGIENIELLRRFLDQVLSWGYEPATISEVI